MRKAFIAAAIAAALFAVGAFAATFNVTSEDIASGSDSVDACADDVQIDFITGSYNSDLQDFEVTGATATFFDEGEQEPTEDCDGSTATLALGDSQEFTSGIDGGQAEFDLTDGEVGIPAGEIDVAAVLVEDVVID